MTLLNFKDYQPVVELSNEQLIEKCASIGATAPAEHTSNRYSFIPTIDAVNYLRDAGFTPIKASQGNPRKLEKSGYQQHVIKFTNTDFDLGDRRIEMNLYNSHDAGSAYILSGGIYRLVCSNGMVVGSNLAEYRHRHVGFDADLFIESAKFVAENMKKITTRIKDWEEIELTSNEKGVFAQAAHQVMFTGKKHSTIQPEQLLNERRTEDHGNSLWTTFNMIQENVTKGGLSGRSLTGRRSRTRAITDIKRDKLINQSMWSMAEYIAEVKQAA